MKKRLDYSLTDTEKVWDAVRRTNTFIKDYSMTHTIQTIWEPSGKSRRLRLAEIHIGNAVWANRGERLVDAIDSLIQDDEDANLKVDVVVIEDYFDRDFLVISTEAMNQEGLRDHMAHISIGNNESIVDLEELLKSTRYA